MKVLHITPQAPNNNSGGAIGVAQTLLSLSTNGYEIDYVGPEIQNEGYRQLYTDIYELRADANVIKRAYRLLCGITNSRYSSWKKLSLNYDKYDAIVMDFTKLDFVLSRINCNKLCVRVHNVEQDYSERDYRKNRTLQKNIIRKLARKQEGKIVSAAKKLVVLSEEDKQRINELYGIKNNMDIVPVCVIPQNNAKVVEKSDAIKILITGSLWFGDNKDGIIWFINNVCPLLNCKFKLVIAGANPATDLLELADNNNYIEIIDTPIDMGPYFRATDLIVCPIFQGAGMKVKVAEAFSYGLPVVGTSHAFIGYKIENGVNSFIANTADEFASAINLFSNMSANNKINMRANVEELFDKLYNIDQSIQIWKKIIEEITNDNY